MQEKSYSTVRFSVATDTLMSIDDKEQGVRAPQLSVQIGKQSQGKIEFTREGWAKLQGVEPEVEEVVGARYLRLIPKIVSFVYFWIKKFYVSSRKKNPGFQLIMKILK